MNRQGLSRRLCRLGLNLVIVLGLVLPFEVPLFHLGFLQITTVELGLYATLAVWSASIIAAGSYGNRLRELSATIRNDPLAFAALLCVAALFLSASAAPAHRPEAIKFALRSLSGILVFFCARSLMSPRDAKRVLTAVVAGALLSALSAVIDRLVPGSAFVWKYFREGNFAMLGLARASGVFGYPTIGAMYWEAIVPLLVVLPFLEHEPDNHVRSRRAFLFVAFGSALVVAAILSSATRSGLAGAAVAAATLALLGRRQVSQVRRASIVALGVILALGISSSAFGPLLGQRLIFWQDSRWLRGEYSVGELPAVVHTRQSFVVSVTLHNTGVIPWRRIRPGVVHLSYHWLCPRGGSRSKRDFEGLRSDLPSDVGPGDSVEMSAVVRGPDTPGDYQLAWDLVEEDVSWFSEQGNPTLTQPLIVEPSKDDAARFSGEASAGDCPAPVVDLAPPSRTALWRAAVTLWKNRFWLGIGPDNFRRSYEAIVPPPGNEPYTDVRIHANSLYFETLADLGIVGIVALGWLFLGLVSTLRTHAREARVFGLGTSVAAATFFVHGALDYFFEFTPLLGLFWLLLGLTSWAKPHARLEGSKP